MGSKMEVIVKTFLLVPVIWKIFPLLNNKTYKQVNKLHKVDILKCINKSVIYEEDIIKENQKNGDRIPITDFSLMKNPSFILLVASYLLGFMGFAIPYMYIIDAAITKVEAFYSLIIDAFSFY